MIRFDDHDNDDLTHEMWSPRVVVWVTIAAVAIMVAGGGVAITYVSALLSLDDLAGVRWWAALTYLASVHLVFVFEFGQLRRHIRRNMNVPVPSCRELRSTLASGRAWVTRLGLALLALFAWAHLLATSFPAAVIVAIPLVCVLSLDIMGWGTWPAHRVLASITPQFPPAGGAR